MEAYDSMSPLLQLIVAVFALFALSRAFLRWRDSEITTAELTFWSIIWASITVIVFQPWITDWVSQKFGIGRGIEFVTYVAIVLVLYLIFRIYVKIEVLEQDITKIASAIALQQPKQRNDVRNKKEVKIKDNDIHSQ